MAWWVGQLNAVFAELTDPANYLDPSVTYRPRRQFECLLSVEQLGRRVQSVLANVRDPSTRRTVSFAALDTLDGLGLVRFERACTLSHAKEVLKELEQALPAAVAEVLLVNARTAIKSLHECQDGFLLSSRVTADTVRVPDTRKGEKQLSKEVAVAQYLRVLRNANHGFTSENDAGRARDETLLAMHDGDVPDGVALLPYLYWLKFLAHPERLRYKLPPRR